MTHLPSSYRQKNNSIFVFFTITTTFVVNAEFLGSCIFMLRNKRRFEQRSAQPSWYVEENTDFLCSLLSRITIRITDLYLTLFQIYIMHVKKWGNKMIVRPPISKKWGGPSPPLVTPMVV